MMNFPMKNNVIFQCFLRDEMVISTLRIETLKDFENGAMKNKMILEN